METDKISRHRVLVATDFGTTFGATSYAVVEPGRSNINPVRIRSKGASIFQALIIFAVDRTRAPRRTMWGGDLDIRLLMGTLPEDDVIRLLKLSLSDEPYAQEVRGKIESQLNDLEIDNQELIALYLQDVKNQVNSQLRSSLNQDLSTLPQEWLISVPQMWTPLQTRAMMCAARNAGIPNCSLVSEPECVAAFHLGQADDVPITV